MLKTDEISLNFILSSARTGSTLLSAMLNMHPEILSTIEEPFAFNLYPKYKSILKWDEKLIDQFCYDFLLFSEGRLEPQFSSRDFLKSLLLNNLSELTGEKAIKLAYFAFLPEKDKSYVDTILDKQLKFHYFIDEIIEYYPKSKFILLVRDPRDTTLTNFKLSSKQNKNEKLIFHAKNWNYEYSILLKAMSKVNPKNYLIVKYENLVTEPQLTLTSICKFLNKKYIPELLEYEKLTNQNFNQDKIKNTAAKQHLELFHKGLTEKVNSNKVGIWKKELSKKNQNIIWSICSNTALSLGYKEEGCITKNYMLENISLDNIKFYILKLLIPKLYYSLPYHLKYLIKKILYGKKISNNEWKSINYYKKTIPKAPINIF